MKEVIPSKDDEVIQATAISRAAYIMPVMLRRVVSLAMARIRIDSVSDMSVTMQVGDVLRALELGDSAVRYKALRSAFKDVMKQVVEIDTDTGWEMYQWFQSARYNRDEDTIEVTFNNGLRPHLIEFLKTYDKLAISDLSKLNGKYSWRIYEMVMTYAGMAGKNGNRAGEWYHPELRIETLRHLFLIPDNQYKRTDVFRNKVIDLPIAEINKADLGIEITPVYKRRGKYLRGVEFHCRKVARNEPKPATPRTKTERDDAELIEQNRELYKRFLDEELKQQTLPFGSDDLHTKAAEGRAIERVREAIKSKEKPKKKGAESGK